MTSTTSEWQSDRLARTYLEGVRGAIPLAEQQIQVLLASVGNWLPNLGSVLDRGCGAGILARAIQREHPGARRRLDFSAPMLAAARAAHTDPARAAFVQADLAQPPHRSNGSEQSRQEMAHAHCARETRRKTSWRRWTSNAVGCGRSAIRTWIAFSRSLSGPYSAGVRGAETVGCPGVSRAIT